MDKNQLTVIVVTAVITTVARWLVEFVAAQSTTVAALLKKIVVAVFKRHWRILPVLGDLFIIFLGWRFLLSAFGDDAPATKGFVVTCSLMAVVVFDYANKLGRHGVMYRLSLSDERKDETIVP